MAVNLCAQLKHGGFHLVINGKLNESTKLTDSPTVPDKILEAIAMTKAYELGVLSVGSTPDSFEINRQNIPLPPPPPPEPAVEDPPPPPPEPAVEDPPPAPPAPPAVEDPPKDPPAE